MMMDTSSWGLYTVASDLINKKCYSQATRVLMALTSLDCFSNLPADHQQQAQLVLLELLVSLECLEQAIKIFKDYAAAYRPCYRSFVIQHRLCTCPKSRIDVCISALSTLSDEVSKSYFRSALVSEFTSSSNEHSSDTIKLLDSLDESKLQLQLLAVSIHSDLLHNNIEKVEAKLNVIKSSSSNSNSNSPSMLIPYRQILTILLALKSGSLSIADEPLAYFKNNPTMSSSSWNWFESPEEFESYVELLRSALQVYWDTADSIIATERLEKNSVLNEKMRFDVREMNVRGLLQTSQLSQASTVLLSLCSSLDTVSFNDDSKRRAYVHILIGSYCQATNEFEDALRHLTRAYELLLRESKSSSSFLLTSIVAVAVTPVTPSVVTSSNDTTVTATYEPMVPNPDLLQFAKTVISQLSDVSCTNPQVRLSYLISSCRIWLYEEEEMGATRYLDMAKDAVLLASETLRCGKSTGESMLLMGRMLFHKGLKNEAQEALSQALRLSRHLKDIRLQLEVLYVVSKMYESVPDQHQTVMNKWHSKALTLNKRVYDANVGSSSEHNEIRNWE